jgi:PAS domain S-box-containing protein
VIAEIAEVEAMPPAEHAVLTGAHWGLTSAELMNAMPVAVYTTDSAGFITSYNDAAEKLWGRAPTLNETRWCVWETFFDDLGVPIPTEQCPIARALTEKQDMEPVELWAVRADGSRVAFLAHPKLLRGMDGEVEGAINTLVDITTHKSAQAAESRLSALVASSADAIVSKDLNGVITSWNDGAMQLFGYAPSEAIGRSIRMLIPPDRAGEEDLILARIRAGEKVEHFETRRRHKDGRLIAVSLTISPIRSRHGQIIGVSKIARDISVQLEREGRIRSLMGEVNHRVKNQFAVILSMVRETHRRSGDAGDFENQVQDRILALSRSHDLLVQGDWRGTTLSELVRAHVLPFGLEERIELSGPRILLRPMAVQYLGMAFHELATNSARYGVLKQNTGKILISWSMAESDSGLRFLLDWQEEFQGRSTEPTEKRSGLGMAVLERIAPSAVGGKGLIEIDAEQARWSLNAPARQVEVAEIDLDETSPWSNLGAQRL